MQAWKHIKEVTSSVHYLNLQKYSDAPFNSIEDCRVDVKFVNAVYDALLIAVSVF